MGIAALAGLAACTSPSDEGPAVRGVYNGPSATQGAVSISHERIEGRMEAMTMDFALADTTGLGALPPGAKIRFALDPDGRRVRDIERLPDTTRLVLGPTMETPPPAAPSPDSATAAPVR